MNLSGILAFERSVRLLEPSLGWWGALSAVCAQKWSKSSSYTVNSPLLDRPVSFRPRTTDLLCYEKVFAANEYEIPFPMAPRVIIDAGANIGAATLFFHNKYPGARIIAIEPESRNFEVLKQNCQGLPNLELLNSALWSQSGRLKIVDRLAENWAFRFEAAQGAASGDSVDAIGVEGLLTRYNLAGIDVLKIDIEGAEKELFQPGCERWLGKVKLIIIELHDRFVPGCSRSVYKALSEFDFHQEVRGENIFIRLKN